jgi:uncharacterized DUF497 family protein
MVRRIELEWDNWNLNHIAKHGVSKREVEEAIRDPRAKMRKISKNRYVLIGSAWGRILTVFLDFLGKWKYYVVTARDSTEREKRIYKRK